MPSWCTVITAMLSLYKDYIIYISLLIQVVLVVKDLPASEGDIEMRFQSLDKKDPLEKGRLPTPVFLSGESHWQRGQSTVLQRVRHDWSNLAHSPLIQFNKNALKIVSISIEPVSHLKIVFIYCLFPLWVFYLDCLPLLLLLSCFSCSQFCATQ